jgi:hypothetical protein
MCGYLWCDTRIILAQPEGQNKHGRGRNRDYEINIDISQSRRLACTLA